MDSNDNENNMSYKVVVNHEGQYSIWPVGRQNAPGWNDEGMSGDREDCLAHIKKVWIDMRPLSLRARSEGSSVEG